MIKPLSNRIIVRPETESVSAGGIYLPEQSKDQEYPQKGEIVAVGPGELDEAGQIIPVLIEEGQKVIFNRFAAIEIEDGPEKFLLLRDTDLIGILE